MDVGRQSDYYVLKPGSCLSQGRASRPGNDQMEEASTESSRLTQADNNVILTPGSSSEWFQIEGFLVLF